MTLRELIQLADQLYPDGHVGLAASNPQDDYPDDTLALYVARALGKIHAQGGDTKQTLFAASREMESAMRVLGHVALGLAIAHRDTILNGD